MLFLRSFARLWPFWKFLLLRSVLAASRSRGGSFKSSGTFASWRLHMGPCVLRLVAISRLSVARDTPEFLDAFQELAPDVVKHDFNTIDLLFRWLWKKYTGCDRNDNIRFVACNWRILSNSVVEYFLLFIVCAFMNNWTPVSKICSFADFEKIYRVGQEWSVLDCHV